MLISMLRAAELDGTQAIADAIEIKDAEPGLSFNGVRITADPNAPTGFLWLTNDGLYINTGNNWVKVA